jgi:uncharacterized membrane protein YphA (DoxX/SURF4 family)
MTPKARILFLIIGALRLLLAGIFGWAGIAKLITPQTFSEGVAAFQIFPSATINIIAMAVPALEIVAATLLLSPWWHRQGSLICVALSTAFIALFVWAGVHGISVSCSCFGSFAGVTSAQIGILRGAALLASSAFLYLHHLRSTVSAKG